MVTINGAGRGPGCHNMPPLYALQSTVRPLICRHCNIWLYRHIRQYYIFRLIIITDLAITLSRQRHSHYRHSANITQLITQHSAQQPDILHHCRQSAATQAHIRRRRSALISATGRQSRQAQVRTGTINNNNTANIRPRRRTTATHISNLIRARLQQAQICQR